MKYNWQQADWPEFSYTTTGVEDALFAFTEETGRMSGLFEAMPEASQAEAILNMMVAEAIKTSEIEGEYLSRPDVVSSIRNKLGMNKKPDAVKDKNARGVGELMVAVRNTFAAPLTEKTLFKWHEMLLGASKRINAGAWRKHAEPMQVISGAMGREKVHFEAPPSGRVAVEMRKFIKWFNDTAPGGKKEIKMAPIRSAIAHLYFESIHPFEDGNGRIGRAIAEKALSQTLGRPVMLSLSQTIEANKKMYYAALEKAQQSNEVTGWIKYFVPTIAEAQKQAQKLIVFTLKKAKFFDRYKNELNSRQLKAITKMMDAGPAGFEGGMTTKKYISITKTSKATATRDLQALADVGILNPEGGGRNVRYGLVIG
jgi:Fic family protein